MISSILKKILKKNSLFRKYKLLKHKFKNTPSEDTEEEFRRLVGTISSMSAVMAALDRDFDKQYYLESYRDVKASGIDPEFHYAIWGWKENRSPSQFFDPTFYRRKYLDLKDDEFPLAHYETNGRSRGVPTNPIGAGIWFQPSLSSEDIWANVISAKRNSLTKAVVILPVYKGYMETLSAIFHCLTARSDDSYSLLVINDCSPDPLLTKALMKLSNLNLFDYHNQSENRGFVATVNHALANLSGDLDVVLLNSDAFVFKGWFGRLSKHATGDRDVATVTPMSNNATICSYPLCNKDNNIGLEITPAELDSIAASKNLGLSIDAPTGVGFCMYIARQAINAIGYLDENSFKVGYGEENDFCMRARKAGLRNLIAGDVFAYHVGSVSFSEIRDANYAAGQANLQKKHPDYPSLIQRHFAADPEQFIRRRLDIARLAKAFHRCRMFITHRWSGGIETYLAEQISDLHRRGEDCLILRVHDVNRFSVEDPSEKAIYIPNLVDLDFRRSFNVLEEIIDAIQPSQISINSFAGLAWEHQSKIILYLSQSEISRKYVIHDYSAISHHYQLLPPDFTPFDEQSLSEIDFWSTMSVDPSIVDGVRSVVRREAFSKLFSSGITVEAPSRCTADLFAKFYPDIDVEIVPHSDHLPELPPSTRRRPDGSTRIVLVGALGAHKGSDCVRAAAAYSKDNGLNLEFHLVGYSDNDAALSEAGIQIWGRYQSDVEALQLISELKPDIIFVSSIWPETFCYTLSFALKLRIPPVVFDLGAQNERVKNIRWAKSLPLALALDPARLANTLTELDVDALWKEVTREI